MIHQQEKHADNVKNWNRISGVMVSVLASMFQSGEMCLSTDCCFSELTLWKSN